MKEIGRKIFYDKSTGNLIVDTGERQGAVIPTSVEQDIETYKELLERNRDTFDVLELPYGAYTQDFAEASGYRVNPETKTLEFTYPDPNTPEAPPVFTKPLTEQVAELEVQNMELMLAVAELSNANETDKIETQLAIAELASMVAGGGQ